MQTKTLLNEIIYGLKLIPDDRPLTASDMRLILNDIVMQIEQNEKVEKKNNPSKRELFITDLISYGFQFNNEETISEGAEVFDHSDGYSNRIIAHEDCIIWQRPYMDEVQMEYGDWHTNEEFMQMLNRKDNEAVMTDAMSWWYNMTDEGRAQFPVPQSDEDIEAYFANPADHILL